MFQNRIIANCCVAAYVKIQRIPISSHIPALPEVLSGARWEDVYHLLQTYPLRGFKMIVEGGVNIYFLSEAIFKCMVG